MMGDQPQFIIKNEKIEIAVFAELGAKIICVIYVPIAEMQKYACFFKVFFS